MTPLRIVVSALRVSQRSGHEGAALVKLTIPPTELGADASLFGSLRAALNVANESLSEILLDFLSASA